MKADLVEKDSELYPILSLFLVRMTGFEPTRLSTLEPDGNDTSVETPVPVLSLFTCLVYHKTAIKSSDLIDFILFSQ